MELDWSTLALEALNFLVLVWLLRHFFYRPVLAVIEKRQAETAKQIHDAEAVRQEAETLKSEYTARLTKQDEAHAAAQARLDAEIAAERGRRLTALATEIETERRRRETLEARERGEHEAALERQALVLATRFAARLLDRLAGPEVDAKLADLALAEIAAQAPEKFDGLRDTLRAADASIKVISAYPLDEPRRQAFAAALTRLAGRSLAPGFSEDATLKAGVYIMAGSWVLMANLRDELGFFASGFEHGD